MKRLLTLTTFVLLCGSIGFAGEIPSVGAPQPQPQVTSATPLGEIPTSGESESLSEAAFSALLTALGLASI